MKPSETHHRLRRPDPGKEMLAEGRRIEGIWQDAAGTVHRRDITLCPLVGRVFRVAFVDTYCELTWCRHPS